MWRCRRGPVTRIAVNDTHALARHVVPTARGVSRSCSSTTVSLKRPFGETDHWPGHLLPQDHLLFSRQFSLGHLLQGRILRSRVKPCFKSDFHHFFFSADLFSTAVEILLSAVQFPSFCSTIYLSQLLSLLCS